MAPRSSKIGDIARRKVASQPGIEQKNSIRGIAPIYLGFLIQIP